MLSKDFLTVFLPLLCPFPSAIILKNFFLIPPKNPPGKRKKTWTNSYLLSEYCIRSDQLGLAPERSLFRLIWLANISRQLNVMTVHHLRLDERIVLRLLWLVHITCQLIIMRIDELWLVEGVLLWGYRLIIKVICLRYADRNKTLFWQKKTQFNWQHLLIK